MAAHGGYKLVHATGALISAKIEFMDLVMAMLLKP